MKKLITLIFTLFVFNLFLTGCQNTAAGFGQDMQNTGRAISKAVNDN